ncbi:MAG: LexA family protein [Flavobacteriales bacterium]
MLIKKTKHLDFYTADTSSSLGIPYFEEGVRAGFPSPAEDHMDLKLDLNKELVKNPNATFYARVKGSSMTDAGVEDGDVLIVDRSLEPQNGKMAVCYIDGEFTLKRIKKEGETIELVPENKQYKSIKVSEDDDFIVWGIVTYVIKKK